MDKKKVLINMVLQNEGGYSNVKGDSGGETYMGIAKSSHPNWSGWDVLEKYKPLKRNEIVDDEELLSDVYEVYDKDYYSPMKIEKMNDLMISAHMLCHGVNAGNKSAVKLLQKSINIVYDANISVDGIVGNDTLKYTNMPEKVLELGNELIKQREIFYNNIVKNKPSQKKFLNGWLNRIKNTTNYVLNYVNDNKSQNILVATENSNNKFYKVINFIIKLIKNIFSVLAKK